MRHLKLAVAATTLVANIAMADTVRLGTEAAFPPWSFVNDAGDIDGFERELGDELCRRAELECVWVRNAWATIIPNMIAGNYDAILSGMSITQARDDIIDFTQNYAPPEPSAYLAPLGDVGVEHGVIAAQTGTIPAAFIAESQATLLEFTTPDEAFVAIRSGQADAILANKSLLEPYAGAAFGLDFAGSDIVLGQGVGIGLREADTALKDAFNAAISAMKADGSLNALITKWGVSSTF
jgi:polar amino acid transport system substrate-binding protein